MSSSACIYFKEEKSMRISSNSSVDTTQLRSTSNVSSDSKMVVATQQGSEQVAQKKITEAVSQQLDNSEETKKKVQEAVGKMNEMLEVTNSTSRFMYHDGLERYYVTVVNRETEEVVKEIPPKKLLDAFYEMQKMLGMIVDEKI